MASVKAQKAIGIEQSAAKPTRKRAEGSTIRVWSLNGNRMAVKPHECLSRKARYDLDSYESMRNGTIKKSVITNRPYSGKLDDLSAQPIKEIINKVLKFDASKAFDIAAHYQFNQCALRVAPTSGTSTTALTLTTNGTCATTNTLAFQKEHAGLVSTLMKERNISPYIADDYYAIAWPSTFETLREDLEGIRMYTSEGYQEIKNGELGRYRNIRFVEQTQIPKGGAADSTTWNADTKTADAWNQAKSDWIFFMGNDTVAEGIAVAEEMRGKIPSDYGRSKGIAWYYLGGFGIVHTQASQTRILKWDSAA
jgi:hypothetical protein